MELGQIGMIKIMTKTLIMNILLGQLIIAIGDLEIRLQALMPGLMILGMLVVKKVLHQDSLY
jgi:hypothetical protein